MVCNYSLFAFFYAMKRRDQLVVHPRAHVQPQECERNRPIGVPSCAFADTGSMVARPDNQNHSENETEQHRQWHTREHWGLLVLHWS